MQAVHFAFVSEQAGIGGEAKVATVLIFELAVVRLQV